MNLLSQEKVKSFVAFSKKNVVMLVALFAAVVTSFIVPVDSTYQGYFDLKTLTCLFCVLAVVCALKNINFFYMLARKVVQQFKNARMCVLILVYITFIGSMLIANDMALLTFRRWGILCCPPRKKKNTWRSPLSCRISPRIWAAC